MSHMYGQIPAPGHRPRCPTPGPPAQTLLPLPHCGLCLQPPDLPGQLPALWCCGALCLWLPGKRTASPHHDHQIGGVGTFTLSKSIVFYLFQSLLSVEKVPLKCRCVVHICFAGRYRVNSQGLVKLVSIWKSFFYFHRILNWPEKI